MSLSLAHGVLKARNHDTSRKGCLSLKHGSTNFEAGLSEFPASLERRTTVRCHLSGGTWWDRNTGNSTKDSLRSCHNAKLQVRVGPVCALSPAICHPACPWLYLSP